MITAAPIANLLDLVELRFSFAYKGKTNYPNLTP